MIRKVENENLSECAQVIKTSFLTVAREFGITECNAASYVAFAVNENKLQQQQRDGLMNYQHL